MNIAASPYLNADNLHFKPLAARLARATLWGSTSLEQKASTANWQGHAVHILSKAALFIGIAICVPVALIEAVSLFLIAGLGLLANNFLQNNRSEFLQKHALKCLSYSIHSLISGIALFLYGLKNPNLRYHTAYALADHILHLGSAGFTQAFIGGILDQRAGRSPQETLARTVNLLSDSHPDVLNDIVAQIQNDFDVNLRERVRAIPQLADYLNRHPQDRDFVDNFNLMSVFNDQQYRERAGQFVHGFLNEAQLVQPGEAHPLRFELNQNTPAETAYQERLARLLKDSFLEIYRTPELARCLDRNGETGTQLLEVFDATTFPPLTAYTQYQELLGDIQCPAQFTGNLVRYNARNQELLAAQRLVRVLNDEQRQNLVQKLLRGADFEAAAPVQVVFLAINRLAQPLVQGPLVTKVAIDLGNIQNGNVIDERNLFQRACREALQEVERR
jgi:hypothetical protein